MFFPAEAAVVNLRRKEAILELEWGEVTEVELCDEAENQKIIQKTMKGHVMERQPRGFFPFWVETRVEAERGGKKGCVRQLD
jgi:hypothetical protein